jgi:hypothetical protein
MHSGRRILEVVGLVALAAYAFAAYTAAASGTATAEVRDTFTHVDVRVSDHGLTLSPSIVPSGLVELTVIDARADRGASLRVRSIPPPINAGPGTTLYTLRARRAYVLTAFVGGQPAGGRGAQLTITVPDVRASREPAHVVRADVRENAIVTPNREMKRQQPFVPLVATPVPADDQF